MNKNELLINEELINKDEEYFNNEDDVDYDDAEEENDNYFFPDFRKFLNK